MNDLTKVAVAGQGPADKQTRRVCVARIHDLLTKRMSDADARAFTKQICIYVEEGTGTRLLDTGPSWAVDTNRFGGTLKQEEQNG